MFTSNIECIVIGCSAGCGILIDKLLTNLNSDFITPIIVIRHLKHDDLNLGYIEALNKKYQISVKEPSDKDLIEKATVYLAPSGYHLMVEDDKCFSLNVDDKIHYTRPSIDVLFESTASVYKNKLLAILLSGSNSDGTDGLRIVKLNGGTTIAQDPVDAEFSYMPESAIKEGVVDKVLPFTEIAEAINDLSIMRR